MREFKIPAIEIVLLSIGLTNCTQDNEAVNESSVPNVIVIFVDDLNNYQTGCYGGEVHTPNIDKLASEGIKFTRYYPSSSVCCPSRFSALTGRFASRCLGLQEEFPTDNNVFIRWNTDIVEGETTIAHILNQQGYVTGLTGKWHNWAGGLLPLQHVPDRENPESDKIRSIIKDNYEFTKEHIRKTSGFDFVEAVYGTNFNWLPITEKLMYHNQHWITFHSLNFIEQNKDKPFFLYMATTIPHHPHAIESLRSDPRATPAGYLTEHLDSQPSYENILNRAKQTGIENPGKLNTWVTMAWLDDGVGAILDKLDELGLRENTLIIFASDNENSGKKTCYQGRAPFIVNWKGNIKDGEVCDELVSNVDILPTILEVCELKKPAEVKLDGLSLTPLFKEAEYDLRNSIYMEVTYTRAVVTRDFKYIAVRFPEDIQKLITESNRREFTQEGVRLKPVEQDRYRMSGLFPGYFDDDQLYDMKTDSLEQYNLASDPEFKQVLEEMQKELKAYSDDLPYPFGEFKNN